MRGFGSWEKAKCSHGSPTPAGAREWSGLVARRVSLSTEGTAPGLGLCSVSRAAAGIDALHLERDELLQHPSGTAGVDPSNLQPLGGSKVLLLIFYINLMAWLVIPKGSFSVGRGITCR